MARFVKFSGLAGTAWFNPDHVWSVGTPSKDGVPLVGMAVLNSPTGPFVVTDMGPDETAAALNGEGSSLIKES